MMDEMLGHLESAGNDSEVRVVLIRAEGPVFSSGHDLRELSEGDVEDQAILFARCTELMEAVRLLPKPVIAQVQGLATAAGCQLVATCDLAVASEDAGFATPGVDIGLFCTTPAVAVGRAVPLKKTMEMLLTGQPIPASDALKSGLVNRVVPADSLDEETTALAAKVASAPMSTVSIGKPAFYRQMAMDRPQAYELAQRVMVENLQMTDAREGIGAFLEKREPNWKS
jgi:enoyl-CoA hydratase/carnithine racemase